MTPREELKTLGIDHHKLADFFGLSSTSFLNSSARRRYEGVALKIINWTKENKY